MTSDGARVKESRTITCIYLASVLVGVVSHVGVRPCETAQLNPTHNDHWVGFFENTGKKFPNEPWPELRRIRATGFHETKSPEEGTSRDFWFPHGCFVLRYFVFVFRLLGCIYINMCDDRAWMAQHLGGHTWVL